MRIVAFLLAVLCSGCIQVANMHPHIKTFHADGNIGDEEIYAVCMYSIWKARGGGHVDEATLSLIVLVCDQVRADLGNQKKIGRNVGYH